MISGSVPAVALPGGVQVRGRRRLALPLSSNLYSVFASFNQSDGPLNDTDTTDYLNRVATSLAWANASTWAAASNQAGNTPATGAEIWDANAAVFTAGTYGWSKLGSNTIANVGNALQVTYVNNAGGAFCGVKATNANFSSNLSLWQWYKFSCDASINTGACKMSVYTGATGGGSVFSQGITTTPTRIEIYFLAHSATNCSIQFAQMGAGEVVTIDNCSLVPVANAELPALLSTPYSDVVSACKVALTEGNPGGLIICADSVSNPQNFICLIADGKYITWRKCVSGVYTSEIIYFESPNSYPSGRTEIAVEKNGTTVKFYYHGALIAERTVTDPAIINNTIHGMFSVDPTTTINNYALINPAEYVPAVNFFAVGDSITCGLDGETETWVSRLAKDKRWKPIVTAHGATRITGTTAYYMSWQVGVIFGASTIIILMGANDTDTSDTTRLNYENSLITLQTNNPGSRIIALGPLVRDAAHDATTVAVSAQIAIAAGNVGVEYHNTHDWLDINTDFLDGLHPNDAGYDKFLTELLAIL